MTIRDRGKLKFRSAFFMPEHVKMLSQLNEDYYKERKPILDEIQIEEFERNLLLAMEYALPIKLKIWRTGFFSDYSGMLHKLDEINKNIFLERANGEIVRIRFDEIVRTEVEDS